MLAISKWIAWKGNKSRCFIEEEFICKNIFNLLAPEFGIEILAHPVCKMWIIREPKKVALWNKRHFEEKKT